VSADYIQALRKLDFFEVSFGYSTIEIFPLEELSQHQLGYAVGQHGNKLTGTQDGDWHESWVVIGVDEMGDPIFIDDAAPGFPVYTAAHGEGRWDPVLLAVSLDGFNQALSVLAKLAAKGREHPVGLEANPLTAEELDAALNEIQAANPGLAVRHWEIVIGEDLLEELGRE
jgi:hypothetical protein